MRRLALSLPCAFLVGCSSIDRRDRCGCPCPSTADAPSEGANPYVEAAGRWGDGNRAIWMHLSATYDVDHDGKVTAVEYPRGAATFKRLDHDGDGVLTAGDFDGPTSMEAYLVEFVWRRLIAVAPESSPAVGAGDERPGDDHIDAGALARAFDRADTNANGRLGERELLAALRTTDGVESKLSPRFPQGVSPFPPLLVTLDADHSGDLSRVELEAWRAKQEADALAEEAQAAKAASDAATTSKAEPKPKAPPPTRRGAGVGDPAPDFTLRTADGAREIALSSYRGVKPVVLIFGSYTCPPFRFSATRLREIAATYASEAQFLFVYIREAHALDGPAPMPSPTQPIVEEPITLEERRTVATSCRLDLGFDKFPTLADGIGNETNKAYAAAPARIYVVAKDGRVAYQGGPGPFGLDPDRVEAAIRRELGR